MLPEITVEESTKTTGAEDKKAVVSSLIVGGHLVHAAAVAVNQDDDLVLALPGVAASTTRVAALAQELALLLRYRWGNLLSSSALNSEADLAELNEMVGAMILDEALGIHLTDSVSIFNHKKVYKFINYK